MTQRLSQKDQRIIKLHAKGITDSAKLAQKIGYSGKMLEAGIARVHEALDKLKNIEH